MRRLPQGGRAGVVCRRSGSPSEGGRGVVHRPRGSWRSRNRGSTREIVGRGRFPARRRAQACRRALGAAARRPAAASAGTCIGGPRGPRGAGSRRGAGQRNRAGPRGRRSAARRGPRTGVSAGRRLWTGHRSSSRFSVHRGFGPEGRRARRLRSRALAGQRVPLDRRGIPRAADGRVPQGAGAARRPGGRTRRADLRPGIALRPCGDRCVSPAVVGRLRRRGPRGARAGRRRRAGRDHRAIARRTLRATPGWISRTTCPFPTRASPHFT